MKDYVILDSNSNIYALILNWIVDKTYLGYVAHNSIPLKVLNHDILIFQTYATDLEIIINVLDKYSE